MPLFLPDLQNAEMLARAFGASSYDSRLFKVLTPASVGSPGERQKWLCWLRVPLDAPLSKTDTPRYCLKRNARSFLTVYEASFTAGVSLGTL